jgi:hypothetical protein
LGHFDDMSDGRVQLANHQHCFGTKTNISSSFELDTLVCNTCTLRGKHRVLRRETERPDTVDNSPICFVLSDQCFPPVLPPEGDGDCFKIVRIEDGGLMELTNAFIEFTKGFVIPAGSVLVLCSATQLASTGTETYAADFVEAKKKIAMIMGDGMVVLHGFPILLRGTANTALARGLLDIMHWLGTGGTGRDITNSRLHCINLTYGKTLKELSADVGTDPPGASVPGQCAGSPGALALYRVRLALPSLNSFPTKTVFEGPAYVGIPQQIAAV